LFHISPRPLRSLRFKRTYFRQNITIREFLANLVDTSSFIPRFNLLLRDFARRRLRMDSAIRKAETLIEALSYIRQFRNRLIVIKLGGSAMEEPDALRATLEDVIFMATVGLRPSSYTAAANQSIAPWQHPG